MQQSHLLKDYLEALYDRYNHRIYIHPDPLEFVYHWDDPLEREIVGLIAATLAYGRVTQILKSISRVLGLMGHSPLEYIRNGNLNLFMKELFPFKHRFTTGEELARLAAGMKEALSRYGSLSSCFKAHLSARDENVLAALSTFVKVLSGNFYKNSLLCSPEQGSACKRLNLYLRWMIRSDEVDPGCWKGIPPSMLVVPLDTHMHRLCLLMSLTRQKSANLRAALEVTEKFREISPEDPVKYDFSLTRPGIRGEKVRITIL